MVLNQRKSLNFKVSLFFAAISFVLIIVLSTISLIAFRQFSISTATEHARTAAEIARVHLTDAMVTGTIAQRRNFLLRLAEVQNLKNVHVVRSPVVDKQFGTNLRGEFIPDQIERHVMQTGQAEFAMIEDGSDVIFRSTIPYTVTNERIIVNNGASSFTCIDCHTAKVGDVLGAVTITMSVNALRNNGVLTAGSIVGVVIVALLILFCLLYFMLRPISATASSIEHAVQAAIEGNFKHRVNIQTNDEIGQIATDTSRLLSFLDEGLNKINKCVSQLIVRTPVPGENLLTAMIGIIENMTRITHYKAAIEEDESKNDVYQRLISTINDRFLDGRGEFSIFEVSNDGNELKPILLTGSTPTTNCRWCSQKIVTDPSSCRVIHNGHSIDGITQPDLCFSFRPGGEIGRSDDVIDRREILAREHLERRVRGLKEGQFAPPTGATEEHRRHPRSIRYPMCFPILKAGSVGSVIQLVVREDDKERILEALPYIRVYLTDTAPVLEVRRLMETLRESSLKDPMTGLNNRRFLEEYIDAITASVRRKKSHAAILMLDLDHFKMINDTYGPDAGDVVLKALANVIKVSVRASDMVIRYGGEEFMVVLQDTTGEDALLVAEKIRASVEAMRINHAGIVLQKTISIGIADFPGNSNTFWQAVKFADVALYHAKEAGRNRVLQFVSNMWSDTKEY